MPPEFNVGITDWERSMKLRQGHFQVLEEEPEYVNGPSYNYSDDEDENDMHQIDGDIDGRLEEDMDEVEDDISSQLDDVRAMLERLLPEDNDETPNQAV